MMIRIFSCLVALLLLMWPAVGKDPNGIFAEFPAEVIRIEQNAKPRLQKGTVFWEYRSAIRAAAEEPPDFAGHYIVVHLGCGTECVRGVLIDAQTGELYEIDSLAYGASYRVDSNLLITGTCHVEDPPSWLKQEFYTWYEKTKEFAHIHTAEANEHHFFNSDEC